MNLVIHDLNGSEWSKIENEYSGWKVISDEGSIKPCVGCFGCWVKTPGQCLMKDGYDKMGALIHQADEIVVISRYTYGGFSSFVKNVFDRSISYLLPYFEVVKKEMHHKRRYFENKPFTFVFRGDSFSEEDKEKAKTYVTAVCTNLRGHIKDVRFEEVQTNSDAKKTVSGEEGKTILLNASMRGEDANSLRFLNYVADYLDEEYETINLSSYISKQEELVQRLLSAKTIVLGIPLYVDGIPSHVLRIMEEMEGYEASKEKKIYVVSSMGMYESSQIKNLLSMIKTWCCACGYIYGGGIAIGAGGMMRSLVRPNAGAGGPAKNVILGLRELANAINSSSEIADIYADALNFSRRLYMKIANSNWPKSAKQNGLKKRDLRRRL